MTAFLHTGDEHVDSDVHGSMNSKTGRSTAWESNSSVVRFLAEKAVELGVDAYISSGDEFKSGRPSQEAVLTLADAMTPLAEANIPVLFLDGNHNKLGVTRGHRTAIHTLAEILRARGGTARASAESELVEVGGIQVATLPWLHVAQTLEILGKSDAAPGDADRLVADWATNRLAELADSSDSSMPLIMAGHVTVAGSARGSEQDITHLFSEPVLDAGKLEQLPFAYGALGHIHTPQSIGSGIYRYAGSPNRLTFTDEPDTKGANLVRLDGGLSVEQVVTPARVLRTIDLADDGYRDVIAALPAGALVRIILPEGEAELDRRVRRDVTLAGAHIVTTTSRPVVKAVTARPALAQSVTIEDALRAWAKAQDIENVDALVKAAANLPGASA